MTNARRIPVTLRGPSRGPAGTKDAPAPLFEQRRDSFLACGGHAARFPPLEWPTLR